jgi:predicted AlkP superfamily pyrophosphatase or phosphodiesterase
MANLKTICKYNFNQGRLVLLLIDALRYDFIFEKDLYQNKDEIISGKTRMPFVNRLLREQRAFPFKLNARPPTVTMPRLKVYKKI